MTSIYEMLQPQNHEALYHLCNQIENILTSYDDEFDAIAELVQNSVDAVFARAESGEAGYAAKLSIHVDCKQNVLTIEDNGCGVNSKYFNSVFRPNVSVKQVLGHKSARGEKGAGIVFLQFGHRRFEFQSRLGADQNSYELVAGNAWFREFKARLNAGEVDPAKLPPAHMTLAANAAKVSGTGSYALVEFDETCNLRSLATITGSDVKVGQRRWEYLLRTRTAIGFTLNSEDRDQIPEPIKSLKVSLRITMSDGSTADCDVTPGFLYPHLQAKGGFFSLLTNPKAKSEMFYDFFNVDYLNKYMSDFMAIARHKTIAKKYDVTGYISYAANNKMYEKLFRDFNGFSEDDWDNSELPSRLIQVNGGFQVAVREYPNGRIRSFLHRGGAEDKSRTFVLFDFKGEYKPDYGRKNLANDVREFVNDFCKRAMSFATAKERSTLMAVNRATAPHGVKAIEDAKKVLASDQAKLASNGAFLGGAAFPRREAQSEAEVIVEFCHYVIAGHLRGYTIYGPSDMTQLDGTFDFELAKADGNAYEKTTTPLGILFAVDDSVVKYSNRWLEFKKSLDNLTDDFKKAPGESGKKWFTLVDLVICYNVDSAIDGYSVEEITEETKQDRLYYGVTHILRCSSEASHSIQVIALKALRAGLKLTKQ